MSPIDFEQMRRDTPDLLDQYIHKILTAGGIKTITGYREDGSAIVEMVDPPAAWFNMVRQRVRDLKMSSAAPVGSATANLIEQARLRFKNKPIPPVSTLPDAATG